MNESIVIAGWLATAPTLREDHDRLLAFADALCDLLRPFGFDHIYTDEPCRYLDTPAGRAAFAAVVRSGYLDSFRLSTRQSRDAGAPPSASGAGWAKCFMHRPITTRIGRNDMPPPPVGPTITFAVRPAHPSANAEVLQRIVAFTCESFQRLGASAGAVEPKAVGTGDPFWETPEEAERKVRLSADPDLRRYLRGLFWGNLLSREMCEILGGQRHVMKKAPVAVARSVGDGVYLQLSRFLPVQPQVIARARRYLTPLLEWRREDIGHTLRASQEAFNELLNAPRTTPSPSLPALDEIIRRRLDEKVVVEPRIPLEIAGEAREHLWEMYAMNLYLAQPPTEEQRQRIIEAITQMFPRSMYFSSSVGTVMRFEMDDVFGQSAPIEESLRALRDWLATLKGVEITKIVAGVETIE